MTREAAKLQQSSPKKETLVSSLYKFCEFIPVRKTVEKFNMHYKFMDNEAFPLQVFYVGL